MGPPTITYEFVIGQLKILAATGVAFCVGKGWLTPTDATMLTTVLTAGGAMVLPFLWSAYTNAGMKKVPANSVAIMPHDSDDKDAPNGANIAGKVVGALLFAFALNALYIPNASAQARPLQLLQQRIASPVQSKFLDIIRTWISSDIDGAIALATAIPDLQDPTGAKCWSAFKGIGDVISQHPLPVTLKLASDVQAARLVAMALKKVCVEPACAQVWLDMQNQVAALAPIGVPFTLNSVCSKVL
jgi:hypothetical protein